MGMFGHRSNALAGPTTAANLFKAAEAIQQPNAFAQPRVPGNIDLTKRPVVKNPDGTISTVRSMSFSPDGKHEILIPTVSDDGRVMRDDEAVQYFYRTGKHLGVFNTPDEATAYAKRLHEDQAKMYGGRR